VLQIHGTADPCWTYAQSSESCLPGDGGVKVGVAESMEGWRVRNGCGANTLEVMLPDVDPNDDTTSVRITWQGCATDTELLRIDGGGHAWPGGWLFLDEDRIGRLPNDFNGSEMIWDFLRAHSR
jgi:polyhydroxybutyrate depolymerase